MPKKFKGTPISPENNRRKESIDLSSSDVPNPFAERVQGILRENPTFADLIKETFSGKHFGEYEAKWSKMVVAAYSLYVDHEGKKMSFEPKPEGINPGFVFCVGEGVDEEKFFVKTFLGEASGRPEIVEIFVAKLLYKLGIGPEVSGIFDAGGAAIALVSSDLSGSGAEFLEGEEAIERLKEGVAAEEGEAKDKALETRILAIEVWAKMLNLGDVKSNVGNVGVTISDGGILSPIILDFNLNPSFEEALDREGRDVEKESFKKSFHSKDLENEVATALGRALGGVDLGDEVYFNAMKLASAEIVELADETLKELCPPPKKNNDLEDCLELLKSNIAIVKTILGVEEEKGHEAGGGAAGTTLAGETSAEGVVAKVEDLEL